jgi:hypothetical protein
MFIDDWKELAASIFRVERYAKEVTSKNQAVGRREGNRRFSKEGFGLSLRSSVM